MLRLRDPWAKVGDAVTLVTPRDKLEEFLNLLPESVKLISCPKEFPVQKKKTDLMTVASRHRRFLMQLATPHQASSDVGRLQRRAFGR